MKSALVKSCVCVCVLHIYENGSYIGASYIEASYIRKSELIVKICIYMTKKTVIKMTYIWAVIYI